MYVENNRLYLKEGYDQVHVLDVANPDNLVSLGTISFTSIFDIAVVGNTLFAAGSPSLLHVINVANPAEPVVLAIHENIQAQELALMDGNILVSQATQDFHVFNVSDPLAIQHLATVDMNGSTYGRISIDVDGTSVAVTRSNAGLSLFELVDPSNPVIVGAFDHPRPHGSTDCAIEANRVYCLEGTGLFTLQMARHELVLLDFEEVITSHIQGAIADDLMALASANGGFSMLNLADPTRPEPLVIDLRDDAPSAVALIPPFAYLAAGGELKVLDVSDSTNPVLVGSCALENSSYGMFHQDGYLYLPHLYSPLDVIDVRDPYQPVHVGEITGFQTKDIWLAGSHAYVAAFRDGVQVLDLSDPAHPAICGQWTPQSGTILNVLSSGDVLYVAGSDGLHVLSISTPCQPEWLRTIDIPCSDLTVSRGRLLATYDQTFSGGLFDLNNPTHPVMISPYVPPHSSCSLLSDDQYMYVVGYDVALTVLDSGGTVPIAVSGLESLESVAGVALTWEATAASPENLRLTVGEGTEQRDVASTAQGLCRWQALDILPWSPGEGERLYNIWVYDSNDWHIAAQLRHIHHVPTITGITSVYPNPFNPQITIKFSVEKPGMVKLCVYDLTGRHVQTLLDEVLATGNYTKRWNGHDEAGNNSASGRYFLQLSTQTSSQVKAITLIR